MYAYIIIEPMLPLHDTYHCRHLVMDGDLLLRCLPTAPARQPITLSFRSHFTMSFVKLTLQQAYCIGRSLYLLALHICRRG